MTHAMAPGRVNLIGDHTDYTGGLVLPMAIDRATVLDFVRGGNHIELDSQELDGHVSIPLPVREPDAVSPQWGRYVAAVATVLQSKIGISGTVSTTIPVGGGLSSSAALEVAVALALGANTEPLLLAQLLRRAEHLATGVPTGIMDQLCILSATEGNATLIDCTSLTVKQIPISDEVNVVVQFVAHRTLEGSEYSQRVAECTRAEEIVGPLRQVDLNAVENIGDKVVRSRARHVVTENLRVLEFADALERGDWVGAGKAMVASHQSLANDYAVSTSEMDAAVQTICRIPGVFGARMTGGGFGGCIVALCTGEADVPGWRVKPSAGAQIIN